jgi:hypothetical protein
MTDLDHDHDEIVVAYLVQSFFLNIQNPRDIFIFN